MNGTSMACPMVSGLAALVMSMRANLDGAWVKQLIEKNVQSKSQFRGLVTTGGLIDVDRTIKALTNCQNGMCIISWSSKVEITLLHNIGNIMCKEYLRYR